MVATIAAFYVQYQRYSIFLAPSQCNEIRPGNLCATEGDNKKSNGQCLEGETLCGKVCCAQKQICHDELFADWCEDTTERCESLGMQTCGESEDTTKCCPIEKTCIYQPKLGKKIWKCGEIDKQTCESQEGRETCPSDGGGHEGGVLCCAANQDCDKISGVYFCNANSCPGEQSKCPGKKDTKYEKVNICCPKEHCGTHPNGMPRCI